MISPKAVTGLLLFVSLSVARAQLPWTTGGNTNLTSTNNILGNTANLTQASQHPIRFFTGNTERMRLDKEGRLLIGAPSVTATQLLHINQGNLLIDGSGNNGNLFLGNGLGVTAAQWGIEYLAPTASHPGGMNFWKPWLSINGTGGNGFANYCLFLRNDGKVGVGTECVPADAKMAVNGKLYAREVEIQTYSWCDSVFNANYPLPTMDELRAYIAANGHLPGIPSEAEVQEKGSMEIMEMNLQLLQKVEELHLYVLQLETRLKETENVLAGKRKRKNPVKVPNEGKSIRYMRRNHLKTSR